MKLLKSNVIFCAENIGKRLHRDWAWAQKISYIWYVCVLIVCVDFNLGGYLQNVRVEFCIVIKYFHNAQR